MDGTSERPGLDDLIELLDHSPSPYHVVASAIRRLSAAGFVALSEPLRWGEVPPAGFVAVDGSLVAWRLPAADAADRPFRLVGAHTDSPGLRVKPRPDQGRAGWQQLGIEVYGGALLNSWLDRDLGIAGRVVLADGTTRLVDVRHPVARVPQLAIHLDRNVNDGLVLDRHLHLTPVWGVGSVRVGAFAEWLGEHAGLDVPPRWWELCLYDVQPAARLGASGDLLASGRLDNQVSCWAGAAALARSVTGPDVSVLVLNDHEEVGSQSGTGASGPLLERVLERLVLARGGDRHDLARALSVSCCISADNAHAVHPNYPDRHDADHAPIVNGGPAIKVNANQRYATSSTTAARFAHACDAAGVPHQVFVSRNNVPCGSTIGPLTATRLGVPTADVGVPQLSMHSARELCGTADPLHLEAALTAFWSM